MSRIFSIRLFDDERALIDEAAALDVEPGDRSGSGSWLRRVGLREAKRVVERKKGAKNVQVTCGGCGSDLNAFDPATNEKPCCFASWQQLRRSCP